MVYKLYILYLPTRAGMYVSCACQMNWDLNLNTSICENMDEKIFTCYKYINGHSCPQKDKMYTMIFNKQLLQVIGNGFESW